jgi:leucyl aminopeptidase (aminopeptidase T)
VRSREARNVFTRLAELSVHGANVQKGQIVLVQAEIGLEEQARATAEAAYKRGAKFVDVACFDPYLKRVRIESADPDTLDFVPQWYGERARARRAEWRAHLDAWRDRAARDGWPRQVATRQGHPRRTAARVPAPTPTPRN